MILSELINKRQWKTSCRVIVYNMGAYLFFVDSHEGGGSAKCVCLTKFFIFNHKPDLNFIKITMQANLSGVSS